MSATRLILGLAASVGLALAAVPATTSSADAAPRGWKGHHGGGWKHHGGNWRHGHYRHHRGYRGYAYGYGPGFALGVAPFVAPYAYGYAYGPRCYWKGKRYGAKYVCR